MHRGGSQLEAAATLISNLSERQRRWCSLGVRC